MKKLRKIKVSDDKKMKYIKKFEEKTLKLMEND